MSKNLMSVGNAFLSAFDLTNDKAYQHWQQYKKTCCRPTLEQLRVKVNDPYHLDVEARRAILDNCAHYNMAIYQLEDVAQQKKNLVLALGNQLGLFQLDANLAADEDSISCLQVKPQDGHQYIPYTNQALSWHTDGYYNKPECQINAIIMHCVTAASQGGVNQLLDHEWIYMCLRDENPAYIKALMHPQAMTIPANKVSGKVVRAAQSGPVFSLSSSDGRLHMRFSARQRNIIWRDDAVTLAAVERINAILADDAQTTCVALESGQGIICNNVLHNRSSFSDAEPSLMHRLIYRARYYDRVQ